MINRFTSPASPESLRHRSAQLIAALGMAALLTACGSKIPPTHEVPAQQLAPSEASPPTGTDTVDIPKDDQLRTGYDFVDQLDPKDLDGAQVRLPFDELPDDEIYQRTIHAVNLKIAADFVGDVCDDAPYPAPTEINSIDDGDDNTSSVARKAVRLAAQCLRAEAGEQFVTDGKRAKVKAQLAMLRRIDEVASLSLASYRHDILSLQVHARQMSPDNLAEIDYVGDRKAAWHRQADAANDQLSGRAAEALSNLEPANN